MYINHTTFFKISYILDISPHLINPIVSIPYSGVYEIMIFLSEKKERKKEKKFKAQLYTPFKIPNFCIMYSFKYAAINNPPFKHITTHFHGSQHIKHGRARAFVNFGIT